MLAEATVAKIASLLRQNQHLAPSLRKSNREIAKEAKCSRRPVDEMALGMLRPRRRDAVDTQLDAAGGRCPKCGRQIKLPKDGWPCLACRADVERAKRGARKRARKRR
jgi:hypothetical protein